MCIVSFSGFKTVQEKNIIIVGEDLLHSRLPLCLDLDSMKSRFILMTPSQTQILHSLWCCRTCCSSPLFQILLTAIFLSVLADPAVQSGLLVMTAREKLSSDRYKSEAITAMRPLFCHKMIPTTQQLVSCFSLCHNCIDMI